jgi:replicative DNA helicase
MTTTTAHVPPHSLDAERSVLGAILLTGEQMLEPIAHEEHLRPEHFYRDPHVLVYGAMLALQQRREPIDTLTVCAQLRAHGTLQQAGGDGAVDELAGWVPVAGHARAYAKIVRDLATRRQLLRACYEIEQRAVERKDEVDELLADASKLIGDLLEPRCRRDPGGCTRCYSTAAPSYIAWPTSRARASASRQGSRPWTTRSRECAPAS